MKQKIREMGWIIAAGILIYIYIWHSMMGFRWPSLYVMANHIVTSKYGFMPRTFINNIVKFFFGGGYLYKRKFLYVLILTVAFLFLLYVIYSIFKQVAVRKNALYFFVFLTFVISPYAKYYLHEAGYFEQYGYLLGILLIGLVCKKSWKAICLLSGVFAFISVLISETNLFLIVPFMFSIALLEIIGQGENLFQRFLGLFIGYIPTVGYSLAANVIRVPKEIADKIQAHDTELADFYVLDIYKYFWNDRSNQDIWGRTLHPIPIECVVLPLMLVCIITFILYKVNKKIAVSYFVLSALCAVFNYSIVILAWDLYRYYFCIYIQIFFLTLYIIKKNLYDYKLSRDEIFYFVIYALAIAGMGRFELTLFDDMEYSRTWREVLEVIQKMESH